MSVKCAENNLVLTTKTKNTIKLEITFITLENIRAPLIIYVT